MFQMPNALLKTIFIFQTWTPNIQGNILKSCKNKFAFFFSHRLKYISKWKQETFLGQVNMTKLSFQQSVNRVVKAIWDSDGHYKLRKRVRNLHVDGHNWHSWTVEKREKKLIKFMKAPFRTPTHVFTSKDGKMQKADNGKALKPGRRKDQHAAKTKSKKTKMPKWTQQETQNDASQNNDEVSDDEDVPFDSMAFFNTFTKSRKSKSGTDQQQNSQKKKWKSSKKPHSQ